MSTLRERIAGIVSDCCAGNITLRSNERSTAAADMILALPEVAAALERQGDWACACGWQGEPSQMNANPMGMRVCPSCGASGGLVLIAENTVSAGPCPCDLQGDTYPIGRTVPHYEGCPEYRPLAYNHDAAMQGLQTIVDSVSAYWQGQICALLGGAMEQTTPLGEQHPEQWERGYEDGTAAQMRASPQGER